MKGTYEPSKSNLLEKLPPNEREKILNQEKLKNVKNKKDSSSSALSGNVDAEGEKEIFGIRYVNNKRIKTHVPQEFRCTENYRGLGRIRLDGVSFLKGYYFEFGDSDFEKWFLVFFFSLK